MTRVMLAFVFPLALAFTAGCSRHIEPGPAPKRPTSIPKAAKNAESVPFEALNQRALGQRVY